MDIFNWQTMEQSKKHLKSRLEKVKLLLSDDWYKRLNKIALKKKPWLNPFEICFVNLCICFRYSQTDCQVQYKSNLVLFLNAAYMDHNTTKNIFVSTKWRGRCQVQASRSLAQAIVLVIINAIIFFSVMIEKLG